jgi:hypothetical protein
MSNISKEDFKNGFEELIRVFNENYPDSLDWVLDHIYFKDEFALRVGRVAGVMLKEPWADKIPATASVTGSRYAYSLKREKLEINDFDNSWQALVYGKLIEGNAIENALWLDGERKTFSYLVGKVYPVVCDKSEDIKPWVDDLIFTLGGALFEESHAATSLAAWLSTNVPILADTSPALLSVFVVLIARMGVRRFCSWAKEMAICDESKNAEP